MLPDFLNYIRLLYNNDDDEDSFFVYFFMKHYVFCFLGMELSIQVSKSFDPLSLVTVYSGQKHTTYQENDNIFSNRGHFSGKVTCKYVIIMEKNHYVYVSTGDQCKMYILTAVNNSFTNFS